MSWTCAEMKRYCRCSRMYQAASLRQSYSAVLLPCDVCPTAESSQNISNVPKQSSTALAGACPVHTACSAQLIEIKLCILHTLSIYSTHMAAAVGVMTMPCATCAASSNRLAFRLTGSVQHRQPQPALQLLLGPLLQGLMPIRSCIRQSSLQVDAVVVRRLRIGSCASCGEPCATTPEHAWMCRGAAKARTLLAVASGTD
jgi:hypothetical protein